MVDWLVIVAVAIFILILVQVVMDRRYLDVRGCYVLITGCDTGFGNVLARTLSSVRGMNVIAACLTREGMEQYGKSGNQTTGKITPIQMDVTSSESIKNALEEVKRIIPEDTGLWGLVNNAGITGPMGYYEWLQRDEIINVLQVNLVGTIEVTNVFYPLLRKARGRIVNMSSMVGIFPTVTMVYALSKAGVEAFSDNIRVMMRNSGVTVHIIEPSSFKTGLTDPQKAADSLKTVWERLPEEEKAAAGGTRVYQIMQCSLRKALLKASPKLHLVTNAIEHALCAKWPWRRYLPGTEAKFFFKPMSLLPAFLTDYIVIRQNAGYMREENAQPQT